MSEKPRISVWWIVGGLLAGLACCVCMVVIGGTSLYVSRQLVPTPTVKVAFPTDTAPPHPASDETLQLLADTVVPSADPVSIAERLLGTPGIPRVLATRADPIPLGTVDTFWVSNLDDNRNFQIEADLVYATDHVYFWVEQGIEFDLEDAQNLVENFENNTYPTTRAFFGSEWTPGVDGDPHLYIILADDIGAATAGYFGPSDQLSPLAHEYSNGHEMFYLSADNLELWEDFADGVLAHEFQHMIHHHQDPNEESWMNEGFSELAALLNGHDVGGMDISYAMDPDQILTYWPSEPGASFPHYGQGFLMLAYFLERFGPEVTQALVANPTNGLDSIDQTLAELGYVDTLTGRPITADDFIQDWAAALLLQDSTIADGRYALQVYDSVPSVRITDQLDRCPVEDQVRDVNQYGLDFIRITCVGQYMLRFDGLTEAQVVPTDFHSGKYALWSNRGDNSNMSAMRSFDFRSVQGPITFKFWVWYDIEEDWDYVYLEASADGGQTWEILTTPSGTDEDPSGNSFGWAYTGPSGPGEASAWIQETLDLSSYAGQEVILRFEYITDASVHGEGFVLDDLEIEAIDYTEDFEEDGGGWETAGFVRLQNRLPQSYRVLVIERGTETRVRELQLDELRHGEAPLTLGGNTDEIMLVVIGTARHTWQPAPYKFSLQP